jgi:uncharacterized protein YaiE (UPF0345 family)
LSSADWTTFSGKVGGSGATGQVAYWNGTSSQTGSNNLFWDAANARLGIGTNAPTESINIVGGNLLIDNNRSFRAKTTGGSSLEIIKLDTSNSLLLGSVFANGQFISYTSTSFRWFQYPSSVTTERMQLTSAGNLLLQNGGAFSDGGQRLQVQGDAFIKGSGATSATNALTIQDSAGNSYVRAVNSQILEIGTNDRFQFSSGRMAHVTSGGSISNFQVVGGNIAMQYSTINIGTNSYAPTIGFSDSYIRNTTHQSFGSYVTFNPTSGTATYFSLVAQPTINQTGGANGITRGLYVNPTLTAAADWRSIEWSNNSGWGLYGAGTANNYLGGNLVIGQTTSALQSGGTGVTIYGASASEIKFLNSTTGTSATDGTALVATGNTFTINNREVGDLTFGTSNAERMRLTAAGRLLLGTTTESTYLLDVNGTARVSGASAFGGDLTVGNSLSVLYNLANSEVALFQRSGSYGEVIRLGRAGVSNSTTINYPADGTFAVSTAGAERMRITSGGNLLVGTTTDSGQKLQVAGTTISTATNIPFQSVVTSSEMYNSFFVNTSTLIGYIGNGDGIITNGGTNNFGIRAEADLIFAAGGNNRRMTITSGGNLLIGTTTDIASSKVTISSTTQGFLPPRMTTTQKNAIGTPAAGLIVYDTDTNKLCCYNGSTWNDLF